MKDSTTPPGTMTEVTIAGRTAMQCVPENDAAPKMPLVILLCGGGGTGADFAPLCPQLAESGIMSVFPNPLPIEGITTWNAGDCCLPAQGRTDDVAFISDVIDHYVAAYPNIDPSRIHVAGMSNGGMLAFDVARHKPEIAGMFIVAATDASTSLPDPSHKVHRVSFHGSADTNIPPQGGTGGLLAYVKLSQDAVSEEWAKINGCASNTTTSTASFTKTKFDCQDGILNEYHLVHGVGHRWSMQPAVDTTAELIKFVTENRRVAAPVGMSLPTPPDPTLTGIDYNPNPGTLTGSSTGLIGNNTNPAISGGANNNLVTIIVPVAAIGALLSLAFVALYRRCRSRRNESLPSRDAVPREADLETGHQQATANQNMQTPSVAAEGASLLSQRIKDIKEAKQQEAAGQHNKPASHVGRLKTEPRKRMEL